jgi:membrane protein
VCRKLRAIVHAMAAQDHTEASHGLHASTGRATAGNLTLVLQFLPEASGIIPAFRQRVDVCLRPFAWHVCCTVSRRCGALHRVLGRRNPDDGRRGSMRNRVVVREAWHWVQSAFTLWMDRGSGRLGAAVAFYSMFSLAPLLMIAVNLAGVFLGTDFAREQFLQQLTSLMGEKTAAVVDTMIDAALESDKGAWAGVTSAITLFIGATGVLVELRNALDAIHQAQAGTGGLSAMVRARLWSFAIVLAIGFLLLVSLIASAIIASIGGWIIHRFPVLAVVTLLLNWTLSLSLVAALFGLLMRWLPSERQSWSSVWPGAILASVLMTIGKELLGLYLGRAAFSDAFGAAGSLVVLVMWIYYSVQVFLFGAAFNEVRALSRRPRETRAALEEPPLRSGRRIDKIPGRA